MTKRSSYGSETSDIVLIDGHCRLCSNIARFVIRRDRGARYRFAALQSPIGQRLLAQGGLALAAPDSFVLVREGRCYTESGAALRLAAGLGGLWTLAGLLLAVPAPLRNAAYRLVARNRYRWFGREDVCLLPTPDIKARFLEDER